MSYLEKFAKEKEKEEKKDKPFSVRVPTSFYNQFLEHINGLGLNLNESIYLLMRKELNGGEESNTDVAQKYDKANIRGTHDKPKEIGNSVKVGKKIGGKGRFTVEPWLTTDDQLPCPLCEKWYSRSNFSRHARKAHDMTTEELLTRYKEGADAMARRG